MKHLSASGGRQRTLNEIFKTKRGAWEWFCRVCCERSGFTYDTRKAAKDSLHAHKTIDISLIIDVEGPVSGCQLTTSGGVRLKPGQASFRKLT